MGRHRAERPGRGHRGRDPGPTEGRHLASSPGNGVLARALQAAMAHDDGGPGHDQDDPGHEVGIPGVGSDGGGHDQSRSRCALD